MSSCVFLCVKVCHNNGIFSEHPFAAGASVRIHLLFASIWRGRHNYSPHNTDAVTEAAKGTCTCLFSWQLTGGGRIQKRTRSWVRPFLNPYVVKMKCLQNYLGLSPLSHPLAAGQSTNSVTLTFESFTSPSFNSLLGFQYVFFFPSSTFSDASSHWFRSSNKAHIMSQLPTILSSSQWLSIALLQPPNPNSDLPCPQGSVPDELSSFMVHDSFSDSWDILLLFLEDALFFLTLLLVMVFLYHHLSLSLQRKVLEIQNVLNKYFPVEEIKIELKCPVLHRVSPETVSLTSLTFFCPLY